MATDELNDELELSQEMKNHIDKLPREIQPERDLWKGIERAISDGKIVRPDFAESREVTPATAIVNWRRMGLIALAAMLLVAFSSGITAYLVRSPVGPASGVLDPGLTEFETVAWEGFLQAERSYQNVTDDLLASLDAQRDELAPETIEIVESNLRLIDGAIAEARAALERDPANRKLVGKLTDMYRTRVNFLEGMSRL
jgi:hypothetical protein